MKSELEHTFMLDNIFIEVQIMPPFNTTVKNGCFKHCKDVKTPELLVEKLISLEIISQGQSSFSFTYINYSPAPNLLILDSYATV